LRLLAERLEKKGYFGLAAGRRWRIDADTGPTGAAD
jgi:hypothetical protein